MGMLLRTLNRRWLGVTGWVYLLSLTLAGLMYWMLPGSRAVHQWSFRRVAYIVGFIDQDRAMLVKQLGGDGCWYILDLTTGAVQQYTEPESVRKPDLKQASRVPYVLSMTGKMFGENSNKLELKDVRTGNVRDISFSGKVNFVRTGSGFYISGGTSYQFVELKTDGEAAMSMDERWLIMSESVNGNLTQFTNWLREMTGWKWPFTSDDRYSQATVLDLFTNEGIRIVLSKNKHPYFELHPQGVGFAAVDISPQLVSIHNYQQDIGNTTIEWYSLPVGPVYHSAGQWGVIVGTFGVPVVLAMLLNLFRYQRVARTSVLTSPHP